MLQSLPRSAEEYAAENTREIGAAVSAVERVWSRMDPADFDGSYAALEPTLLAVLDTAQDRVSTAATAYVPQVMADLGLPLPSPAYSLKPGALVGVTGDGLTTEGLAYRAVIGAKRAVSGGMDPAAALAQSGQFLTTATGTLLSDTGRSAERVAGGARGVDVWVRMLVPPSCGRCVILAGRISGSRDAFQRHPKCFPAGVVVSGPAVDAASRRWYEGELTILHTASGKRLPATGNHPVLTDQGWIPAYLVNEGDHVISGTVTNGAVPLVIPDEHQAPSLIEDVWRSLGMASLRRVPTSTEDFHGDGGHGEVDVVLADRLLWHGRESALNEFGVQESFAVRVEASAGFARGRTGDELVERLADAAHGIVSSGGLSLALAGRHLRGAHLPSGGSAAHLDAVAREVTSDDAAAHAVAHPEAVLALAAQVRGGHLVAGQDGDAPRWDAPASPFTVEGRAAYASRGKDLRVRLSGQVAADRVVKVERVQWSGHVYNLTSSEGWFSANGLIVSNCDCRNVPATEDIAGDLTTNPGDYLDSLDDAGLARALGSKANAQAYRMGADRNQLVNAYRGGVRQAQVYGRGVKYTTEGTTRSGFAYTRMRSSGLTGEAARRGETVTRITRTGPESRTVVRNVARAPRLMPESIFQIATDPADAQRLLRMYGWIL